MKLLADECVDRRLMEWLRSAGHEIVEIAALEPGLSDLDVLATSRRLGLVLLTRDKDFGELVIRHAAEACGILLLRLRHGDPAAVGGRVSSIIAARGAALLQELVIVDRDWTRIMELRRPGDSPAAAP